MEPGRIVVSEVSWIVVGLEERSQVRGKLFDVIFFIDFGRSDLGLKAHELEFVELEQLSTMKKFSIRLIHGQTLLPGNSTFLIQLQSF